MKIGMCAMLLSSIFAQNVAFAAEPATSRVCVIEVAVLDLQIDLPDGTVGHSYTDSTAESCDGEVETKTFGGRLAPQRLLSQVIKTHLDAGMTFANCVQTNSSQLCTFTRPAP